MAFSVCINTYISTTAYTTQNECARLYTFVCLALVADRSGCSHCSHIFFLHSCLCVVYLSMHVNVSLFLYFSSFSLVCVFCETRASVCGRQMGVYPPQ